MSWRGATPDRKSSATTRIDDGCSRAWSTPSAAADGSCFVTSSWTTICTSCSKRPGPISLRGCRGCSRDTPLWVGRRRQRLGHLFQGRYRAEMIEDESYYWTVSRYIHLNPVRARLVPRPEQWEWSSYPGYRLRQRRQAWVAHDALLAAWRGDYGGKDAAAAYVRFVEAGLKEPPASPFREAFGGWILDSRRFIDELRTRVGPVVTNPPAPEALQLAGLDPERICATGRGLSRRQASWAVATSDFVLCSSRGCRGVMPVGG